MRDASTVPVVASTGLADLLTGPTRPGAVVAVGPAATYVDVAGPSRGDAPRMVAIESPDAVGLPCGVTVTGRVPGWPAGGVAMGTRADVGAGRVTVDGTTFVVARWRQVRPSLPEVDPAVLRVHVDAARSRLPVPEDRLGCEVADLTADLAVVVARADLTAASAVVGALCGLGAGSTPSGDDVVAGAVAAGILLAADGDHAGPSSDWYRRLGAHAAATAPGRTTTLSAALLGHAARGEVADPVAVLLRAITGSGEVAVAMTRLLAVGHHSGADLAAGVLLAAEVAAVGPSARTREVARA